MLCPCSIPISLQLWMCADNSPIDAVRGTVWNFDRAIRGKTSTRLDPRQASGAWAALFAAKFSRDLTYMPRVVTLTALEREMFQGTPFMPRG
jgi:hypothetical protein